MSKPELVFLHCNFFPRCQARVDKFFVGYHTLQFMTGGGLELWYGKNFQRLEGTWFWPAYPGPHIRFHCASGHPYWVHRYVAFQGPLVEHWKKQGLWITGPQPAPRNNDYSILFDEILSQARVNEPWSQRRAANLLEGLLIELARAREQPASQEPWLESVLNVLDEPLKLLAHSPQDHCTEPNYAHLAQKLDMGLSTLRRRFVKATGTPLHDYFMKKRVESARILLGETDWPVKRIAERLGYRDVYFFSRQFKQLTGVPPGQYRRSRQS